jgi:putative protein kinase ArgK-like GTPase of G3E family
MDELARSPQAFIRGCPSRGVLGGIAQYTNDVVSHLYVAEKCVLLLCEHSSERLQHQRCVVAATA